MRRNQCQQGRLETLAQEKERDETRKIRKIFVYGTLKDSRRDDDFYVHGTLYNVGYFPGLKIVGKNKIPGQIFIITGEELESLDKYEGVPSLYVRRSVTAYSEAGESERVWVYEYNRPTDNLVEIDRW